MLLRGQTPGVPRGFLSDNLAGIPTRPSSVDGGFMAKLYKKIVRGVTFACYSERGIVAYFMLRVLPTNPVGFLHQIVDGAGDRPFASVQADQIINLTIFSELVFG